MSLTTDLPSRTPVGKKTVSELWLEHPKTCEEGSSQKVLPTLTLQIPPTPTNVHQKKSKSTTTIQPRKSGNFESSPILRRRMERKNAEALKKAEQAKKPKANSGNIISDSQDFFLRKAKFLQKEQCILNRQNGTRSSPISNPSFAKITPLPHQPTQPTNANLKSNTGSNPLYIQTYEEQRRVFLDSQIQEQMNWRLALQQKAAAPTWIREQEFAKNRFIAELLQEQEMQPLQSERMWNKKSMDLAGFPQNEENSTIGESGNESDESQTHYTQSEPLGRLEEELIHSV